MAQVNSNLEQSLRYRVLHAKNLSVACPASGSTTLLTLNTQGLTNIGVVLLPTVDAFDGFSIDVRFHPASDFVTLYNTAGAFTSPAGLLIGASGDLTTLAAAATGWFIMDVRGIHQVRVTASGAASDDTVASAYASGS